MIIVTGANGQLGHGTIERLLERVPAEQVGASVRDVEKARDLADRGVRVRQGDFADPASLVHAFEGATQILIVSANSIGEELLGLHRRAIDAAKASGARRVLYTSHMGANPSSVFRPCLTTPPPKRCCVPQAFRSLRCATASTRPRRWPRRRRAAER